MKTLLKSWILLLLSALLCTAFAQTGSISGIILDQDSGEELTGVNVLLENTVMGASSALNGTFEIASVPAGDYELTAILLGYKTIRQSVSVTADENLELRLEMKTSPIDMTEVLIETDRVYSAASSKAVRAFDIKVRPTRSSQELLQMAPGVIIAQHAGGGKAEQIFIRGFDADHGTDVNISVDGAPANMISHGHGQGYADLHYVIADVVETIDVKKGPYFAQYGNLATAGAMQFHTKEHIDNNLIRFEGGEFNTQRLTTMYQIPQGNEHQNAYVAGQFYTTDGPVDQPQGFERFNIFGKMHTHLSANSKLILSATAFSSAWDASGQIPQRSVDNGDIGRFGSIDDLEGGATSRQDLNLQYIINGTGNSELKIQTYATRYDFKLFSNFTFFLDNPTDGDMIEQTDDRRVFGVNSVYKFNHSMGAFLAATKLGGGFRSDDITVSLWQSPNRVRSNALVNADINERNFFLWAEEEFLFSPKFRMQLGLRGDYFTYNVQDMLDGVDNGLPHASGYAQQSILSPKFNMVFSPTNNLDFFFNSGTGFHSNDARNVVIGERINQLDRVYRRAGLSNAQITDTLSAMNFDPEQRNVETLPRAIGAEIGFRTVLAKKLNFSAALWWLDLEREYVFVGDAGTTELSDPTVRYGVDLELRATLLPWLWSDLDLNISEGRVQDAPDGEDFIALAPTFTSSGGITAAHPSGWETSLRYRFVDDRPANETNSVVAEGYTVLDLSAGYPIGAFKLHAWIENLLDVDWNEAQFDTESRLRDETNPVSEIHFTPGNPRNVRVGLSYRF
ncbi:MAG: TonB-dependent receptor [Calditrichota bacterium]